MVDIYHTKMLPTMRHFYHSSTPKSKINFLVQLLIFHYLFEKKKLIQNYYAIFMPKHRQLILYNFVY